MSLPSHGIHSTPCLRRSSPVSPWIGPMMRGVGPLSQMLLDQMASVVSPLADAEIGSLYGCLFSYALIRLLLRIYFGLSNLGSGSCIEAVDIR
jgi:hypothetical protein